MTVDMRFLWCGNQAVVGLDMREDNLDMREENLMGFGLLVWSLRDYLFELVWVSSVSLREVGLVVVWLQMLV